MKNNTFSMSYGTTNSITNTTNGLGYTNAVLTTNYPTVTYAGTDISKAFIGWDEPFKELEKIGERLLKNTGNFPPYNVVKEDEDTYFIEFAVAGFSKKDITISQEKNMLIVEGSIEEDDKKEYVHKGIATRSFSRTIALADYVEVRGAEYSNGILIVKLVRDLPKEEKPRIIDIK